MRWLDLFADLEGQARAWDAADLELEIVDRTRAETAQVLLANRLRRQLGTPVRVDVLGAGPLSGTLARVGADWLLLAGTGDIVVPLGAVTAAIDLPMAAVSPAGVGAVDKGLRLASALRAIAIDRCPVRATLRDGAVIVGTPQRVGADWVDIARHDADDVARGDVVRGTSTVPFAALAAVLRVTPGWG